MKVKIKYLDCFISDGNYSSKYPKANEFVEYGIPFIRANNMINNTIIDKNMYYITEEKHGVLLKGHLKKGDVLITTRGSLGQVSIVPDKYEDANINAQIVLIRLNPEKMNNRYLLWSLKSQSSLEQINKLQTGTTLKQLPIGKLKNIEIEVPNLQKQIDISNILDKIQDIIDIRKHQIEDLDNIIKSRFVELFGDQFLGEFKFDQVRINDVINNNVERANKSFKNDDKIKYIDISSIDNKSNTVSKYTEYIFKEAPSRAQQKVEKNDIMISTVRPNLNNVAIVLEENNQLVASSGFCILRANNDKINAKYLFAIVNNSKFAEYLSSQTTGANYPAVNGNIIKDYYISLPPLESQNEFANFVEQINKLKFETKKSLEEIEKLQKSLMNKYFR